MEHRDVGNLQALAAQVQELRETVAAQQEVLAALQRQEEMATPRVQVEREHAAPEGAPIEVAEATPVEASECGAPKPTKRGRRALLKGAGAMAAAATVALAAGEHQTAHAASAADGSYLVIGAWNTGINTTTLQVSSGATPLSVINSGAGIGADITGSNNGIGVRATVGTGSGTGVEGHASGKSSKAVAGYDDAGWAVYGESLYIDMYAGGSGRILQKPLSYSGPPTLTDAATGEMMRDKDGELWLCMAGGGVTSAIWVRVAHPSPYFLGGAISYLFLPARLLDSRSGASDAVVTNGGGPYTATGGPYTLQVGGVSLPGQESRIPSNAIAAIGNVTVVASSGGKGYVSLVPHGAGFQGTSNINYVANQTIANFFTVALSSDGKLDIYIGGAATDVIIDIFGFVS